MSDIQPVNKLIHPDILSNLPECLHSSLLCYTLINSPVIDNAPEISTCNSNGYLYEIKDKKIIGSLDLNEEQSLSITSYHIFEEDKFFIYYLIYTTVNKLLIVKRRNKGCQITKVLDNIKEFKVFDFDCVGRPQIKLSFFNSRENEIIEFSNQVFNTKTDLTHSTVNYEENEENESDKIEDALSEKLMMVKLHIEELKEEYNQIKKLCSSDNFSSKNDFQGLVNAGAVKFSSPIEKEEKLRVSISKRWNQIFGNYFVIGMKIHNNGSQVIDDLDLFIEHPSIKNFTFCFFSLLDDSFWPVCVDSLIKPGEDIFLVGSFLVPTFTFESKLTIMYMLSSSDEILLKDTFDVNILELATNKGFQFELGISVEDLMAIKTLKTETKLIVETKGGRDSELMETLLLSSLNFKKVNQTKEKIFFCDSAFLREVFLVLKDISVSPTFWRIDLYTSCDEQIYFLVNALYDLLPDGTTISDVED